MLRRGDIAEETAAERCPCDTNALLGEGDREMSHEDNRRIKSKRPEKVADPWELDARELKQNFPGRRKEAHAKALGPSAMVGVERRLRRATDSR